LKIGIYGGSFNPPHLGHQNAAVEAVRKCGLDKLLLIPAGIPPHKVMEQGSPANKHRLAMTRLMGGQAALQSGVEVEVLDLEMAREGKNNRIKFTVEGEKLFITSNSEIGDVFEEMSVKNSGGDIVIAFNVKYMMELIRVVNGDEMTVKFGTPVSPCVIAPVSGDDYTYLVLPVRLNA